MKKISIAIVIILYASVNAFAQVNKTSDQKRTINPVSSSVAKQATPQGDYCSYCKTNYPDSHFPCIMKSINGKIEADGNVSFRPGEPIGGIIVKGGRNPGGTLNVTTNNKGEMEINNATAGNYRFIISLPTNNPNARVSGTPIGGIVVKGGKNPGGQMFTIVTNANGEFILNNLEAGNYKLVVMGPTQKEKSSPLYNSPTRETFSPLYKGN